MPSSAATDAPSAPAPVAPRRKGWRHWGQQLYVRIWLAVVLAVAVLTILVGWAWRLTTDAPLRELTVRNTTGEIIGTAQRRPPRVPGELPDASGPVSKGTHLPRPLRNGFGNGPEFLVHLNDGQVLHIHLPRPPNRSPFGGRPYGFFWMLAMVGIAVALATYPIVRRLTRRLETLQHGVERWGNGDLSARVSLNGHDEVGRLAARFNDAAARIEGLVTSHKSLLANASHELRSPLTRIRMSLEFLDSSSSVHSRHEIARNIAELDQLIDEILLASRLDAREADMGTVETVDLTGLLAEECARAEASLEVRCQNPESVQVKGVVKLVRRVVRNLLENAHRYSHGDVQVSLVQDGPHAVIRVEDRGPGVPVELRQRIFEPFYRLPGASEQSGGVGLGLALVKSITERMGGSVHCEGREPHGACFVVRLPRAL